MRGYTGREAPPADKERLTIGPGQYSLMRAIEQVKLANEIGAHFKTKFLRVSPERYGVNFVTYDMDGRVKTLVEIGELPYDELGKLVEGNLPVVYPADPFIAIPTLMLIQRPVTLVVRFKDCVAYSVVASPEHGKSAGFVYRIGHVKLGENAEQASVVLEIPSESFKVVTGE